MTSHQSVSSTSSSVGGSHVQVHADLGVRKLLEEKFEFEGWAILVMKSPILPSQCYCAQGTITIAKHASLPAVDSQVGIRSPKGTLCQVCRFSRSLTLHHLPEMVFPDNLLRLTFQPSNLVVEFDTLDAMKLISTSGCLLNVACSEEWKATSSQSGLPLGDAIEPYDWTYSTTYKGNLYYLNSDISVQPSISNDPSSRLNIEKLKQPEEILFYQEIPLYEDELHDNGISNLSVKLRVMSSGFFILLRFFLRIDNVFARFCDTRIHYETGNSYFIRQVQRREECYQNLSHLQAHIFTDPNILYTHLPLVEEVNETIQLALQNIPLIS